MSISIRSLAVLSNINSMQLKALSYQIADSIDLKAFKTAFPLKYMHLIMMNFFTVLKSINASMFLNMAWFVF